MVPCPLILAIHLWYASISLNLGTGACEDRDGIFMEKEVNMADRYIVSRGNLGTGVIRVIGHTVYMYYYNCLPELPQKAVQLKKLSRTFTMSWRLEAILVLAGTCSAV